MPMRGLLGKFLSLAGAIKREKNVVITNPNHDKNEAHVGQGTWREKAQTHVK